MSLVRWYPNHELYADDLYRALVDRVEAPGPAWTPAVDVSETPTEYLIQAELPGVAKDDIKITLEDHTLKVEGERKAPADVPDRSQWRAERPHGPFQRCFCVPDDVDETTTSAEFKDGVLSLHLLKNPAAAPRTIEVHTA